MVNYYTHKIVKYKYFVRLPAAKGAFINYLDSLVFFRRLASEYNLHISNFSFCLKKVLSNLDGFEVKLREYKQDSVACKNYTRIIFNIKRKHKRLTVKRL